MRTFRFISLLTLVGLCSTQLGYASPKRFFSNNNRQNNVMEELHNTIDDIKYETANHEAEIRMFEEKLNNQEIALDSLWKQLNDTNHSSSEKLKDNFSNFEMKISNIESSSKNAVTDLQQLKTHANDTAAVMATYKQKIAALEKIVDVQNQNIDHLQQALKAMMEALQIKDVAVDMENPYHMIGAEYQVKAGDSLEKIARRNHTTVHKLKELNHLNDKNDLIIVGQKLRLPESS